MQKGTDKTRDDDCLTRELVQLGRMLEVVGAIHRWKNREI